MSTVSRILCGVDFTDANRPAFDWAVRLARASGPALSVVHAVPRNHSFSWKARERLRDLADLRHAALAEGVSVGVSVQHGNPAEVLALHANARRADLIVLGTKGRTGWDRLKTRSVAQRVLRRVSCPSLIVPANAHPKDSADGATIFGHVLCAVDCSATSKAALDEALRLASSQKARLTVLHVLKGLEPSTTERLRWHFAVPEYRHLRAREARLSLEAAIPAEVRAAVDLQIRVVSGLPDHQILLAASDVKADVIIVGARGRGLWGVLSSTTAGVLRESVTPVLVLPRHDGTQAHVEPAVAVAA